MIAGAMGRWCEAHRGGAHAAGRDGRRRCLGGARKIRRGLVFLGRDAARRNQRKAEVTSIGRFDPSSDRAHCLDRTAVVGAVLERIAKSRG